MDAERASERLSAAEVAALAALPRHLSWTEAQDAPTSARFARCHALFRASGATDPGGEWSQWVLPTSPPRGCPGPKR